jgi:hypothetical protein
MTIKSNRDLKVWKVAIDMGDKTYKVTEKSARNDFSAYAVRFNGLRCPSPRISLQVMIVVQA